MKVFLLSTLLTVASAAPAADVEAAAAAAKLEARGCGKTGYWCGWYAEPGHTWPVVNLCDSHGKWTSIMICHGRCQDDDGEAFCV